MAGSSPARNAQQAGIPRGSRFFFAHRVWLWAIPLAWLTTALVLGAEHLRLGGLPVAADLLDVLRFAAYWFWCRLAWQRAGHAGTAGDAGSFLLGMLSKAALAAGFVVTVLV
jgi:hypothetical protein